MRTGPRTALAAALLTLAFAAPASAADSLNVFVDNSQVALGGVTTIAAHAETDAGYGGGHVTFKYEPSDQQCAAAFGDDPGTDANGEQTAPVDPGPSTADVGGQTYEFDVGSWRICGWLVDDATGASVANGSTVVTVVPYMGSVSLSLRKSKLSYQVVVSYETSEASRLFVSLHRGWATCPPAAAREQRTALWLLPKAGRPIGGQGGIGRSLTLSKLKAGRWTACAWIEGSASDPGAKAGPATKRFSVPKPKTRR